MPIAIPFAEDDGRQVLVPTVAPDGAELDEAGAIEQYKKSGKHYGKFDTAANAQAYADQMSSAAPAADAGMPGVDIPYGTPAAAAPPGAPALTPQPATPGAPPSPGAPIAAVPPAPQPAPDSPEARYSLTLDRLNADPVLMGNPAAHQHAVQRAEQAYRSENIRTAGIERARKQASDHAADVYVQQMIKGNMEGLVEAIGADPNLDKADRENLWKLAEQVAKRPLVDPVVSSTTMHELMRGIAAGDVDRNQVIDAFNAKPPQLSETHFGFLIKQLDDIRTPEGLKIAKDVDKLLQATKGSITKSNPLMGHIDASGDLQFGAFEEDIRRTVESMKLAKKSPAEIGEYLSAKRFRDNPALLEPYQKTLQQSIQDQARSLARPPPPPSPGTAAALPAVPLLAPSRVFTAPIPPLGSAEAPAVVPIPPVPPNAPAGVQPRLPGESVGDYMKRTGGGMPAR